MPHSPVDPVFLRLQALVAGRFSLEREIGRGGMGIVFLARDVALERPVAIKVLSPAFAARPDMRARFLREARIAAQCFHPHIVPIHAVEEAGDLAWIVMAYVRGETLADRIRRCGPLDADELRRLGREVGWALSYAHQRGVVHRDIKPENLLIDASTERYVIADFGIAQGTTDEALTPAGGTVPGTARYMAPEQAFGEAIDGRADLYALGVTLFVAATGRAPFEASTAMAMVTQHAMQPAPCVRTYAPVLPLSLARAIDRCLLKQPDDRFADAAAFLSAIEPDVRELPLAPALHAARDHAAAARTMLWWALVAGTTGVLLIAGEDRRSIGAAVMTFLCQSVVALFVASAAFRGAEALLEARRVLRLGHPPEDVTKALAGEGAVGAVSTGLLRGRGAALAQLAGGVALAIAQGWLTSRDLPEVLNSVVQAVTLLLPPMLIARGGAALATSTGLTRWLRRRVTQPIAAFATRMLGRGQAMPTPRPVLEDAPTEVLLVRAVESAVGALKPAHRETLGSADAVAHALAREASALREQGHRLDEREADALVLRDASERADALESVRHERETVNARLRTAMTALESLRLDVLQLAADDSGGNLTVQLEQVREVQRRVDAAMDVRRVLNAVTPS